MKTHNEDSKTEGKVKYTNPQETKELKTDLPLSEKDEFKKAETRTRKALKDHL